MPLKASTNNHKPKPQGDVLDYITPQLRSLAVRVDSVVPDPENSNQHGERSVEAIKASLAAFGQLKPIVVREDTRHVVAGNGTLEAAIALGWTHVAAVVAPFDRISSIHFGLADNRTAQLARLDNERVAAIIAELDAAGVETVGYTMDELTAWRISEWTPPEDTDDGGTTMVPGVNTVIQVTPEHKAVIATAIAMLKSREVCKGYTDSQALNAICTEWTMYQIAEGENDAAAEPQETTSTGYDTARQEAYRYPWSAPVLDDDIPF